MPMRSMTATPEELAGMGDAFSRAWNEIVAMDGVPSAGEASKKEWLAHIVLGLSATGPNGNIARTAVEQFVATVPVIITHSRS